MGYTVVEQDILLEMETPRKCTLRSREYLRGVEKYFV
jgi:hypothetical protein